MMRTFCHQSRVNEEAKHAETVVDRDEHHVFGAPLLSVELGFRAEALAIAATMNPQGDRQLLVNLTRSLGPYVQIQTILTESGLLAVAPLGVVATSVLDGLETRTSEGVADFHALPGHDGLRLSPTVLANGRRSIGDATIDKHVWMIVGQHTLNLTTLDC